MKHELVKNICKKYLHKKAGKQWTGSSPAEAAWTGWTLSKEFNEKQFKYSWR